MYICNQVICAQLGCELNLREIALQNVNVIYRPRPFDMLQWRHRSISKTCLFFAKGRVICHGSKKVLRQYARLIQRMGYDVHLHDVRLVNQTACHDLGRTISYEDLVNDFGFDWVWELFNGAIKKIDNVTIIAYSSGKLICTGFTLQKEIDEIILPQIELLENYKK